MKKFGRVEASSIPLVMRIARSMNQNLVEFCATTYNMDLRDAHPGYDPRCKINLHVKAP